MPAENEKKIAFITCVNNERFYEECLWYLDRLIVPKGYEIEAFPVRGASSMCEGYNIGMHASDAKYKIYLHQDLFLVNPHFLEDLISLFLSDADIGLVGLIGTDKLSKDAVMWNKWKVGSTLAWNGSTTLDIIRDDSCNVFTNINAVDGMLMATQYDFEWREDLDLGWDFYDISQSLEFLKNDKKIAVICNKDFYSLHECGCSKLESYEHGRKIMLEEYEEFFQYEYLSVDYSELYSMYRKVFENEREMLSAGNYKLLCDYAEVVSKENLMFTEIRFVHVFCEIYKLEKKEGNKITFFDCGYSWDDMVHIYNELRFALRRASFYTTEENIINVKQIAKDYRLSNEALWKIATYSFVDYDKELKKIFAI